MGVVNAIFSNSGVICPLLNHPRLPPLSFPLGSMVCLLAIAPKLVVVNCLKRALISCSTSLSVFLSVALSRIWLAKTSSGLSKLAFLCSKIDLMISVFFWSAKKVAISLSKTGICFSMFFLSNLKMSILRTLDLKFLTASA